MNGLFDPEHPIFQLPECGSETGHPAIPFIIRIAMIEDELTHARKEHVQVCPLATDKILPGLILFQKGITIHQIHAVIF